MSICEFCESSISKFVVIKRHYNSYKSLLKLLDLAITIKGGLFNEKDKLHDLEQQLEINLQELTQSKTKH